MVNKNSSGFNIYQHFICLANRLFYLFFCYK